MCKLCVREQSSSGNFCLCRYHIILQDAKIILTITIFLTLCLFVLVYRIVMLYRIVVVDLCVC